MILGSPGVFPVLLSPLQINDNTSCENSDSSPMQINDNMSYENCASFPLQINK